MRPSVFLWGSVAALLSHAHPSGIHAAIADYREPVEWRLLDNRQLSVDREEFDRRLRILSPDGAIHNYIEIHRDRVTVFTGADKSEVQWELLLAPQGRARVPGPHKFSAELIAPWSGVTEEQPLAGRVIALDPGHIGGEWSRIEERHMEVRRTPPVKEGDLTRIVCERLAPLLAQAGAEVVWVVRDTEPVTPLRPDDLLFVAIDSLFPNGNNPRLARLSPSLLLRNVQLRSQAVFYRGAEISARAARVRALQPDLTLCVHYNAAPDTRRSPRLFNVDKLVVFVHGSYGAGELALPEQRFHLFRKLLEGSQQKEYEVSAAIADHMLDVWQLPPEDYGNWNVTHPVGENPYVWSRNLIANRLFDGPTVFVEGPYMNSRRTFYRLQAGDYDGEKEILGRFHRSLHREFAEIIANGVIDYYRGKAGFVGP